MKLKRESLKNGEIFIWMDFAENFTCSAVDEWNETFDDAVYHCCIMLKYI
jgi:hypothetical protein